MLSSTSCTNSCFFPLAWEKYKTGLQKYSIAKLTKNCLWLKGKCWLVQSVCACADLPELLQQSFSLLHWSKNPPKDSLEAALHQRPSSHCRCWQTAECYNTKSSISVRVRTKHLFQSSIIFSSIFFTSSYWSSSLDYLQFSLKFQGKLNWNLIPVQL